MHLSFVLFIIFGLINSYSRYNQQYNVSCDYFYIKSVIHPQTVIHFKLQIFLLLLR